MALEVEAEIPIESITHPHYSLRQIEWYKWRLAFESGWVFIEQYLRKFRNEHPSEFNLRKQQAYCPAFAKAAVQDVINSVVSRLHDISRKGGSSSYQTAIKGEIGGMDMIGSSMNTFMATEVLPELLVMSKVGIYVDMPPARGATLADNQGLRPYLYVYKAEDIRSWDYSDSPAPNMFRSLLLRDTLFTRDMETRLPSGTAFQYRHYYIDDDGVVWCQFYTDSSEPFNPNDPTGEDISPIRLNISRIPFVTVELSNSLMADIADYQIALLNIASSALSFAIEMNFPFYTEQFDPRAESSHLKSHYDASTAADGDADEGGVTGSAVAPNSEISVGVGSGRKYAKGLERPGFIAPSSEPLKASLAYMEQLKAEIRLLINLTITNLSLKVPTAQERGVDEKSFESGLTFIGLTLEDAERQVADIWQMYEAGNESPTIKYPEKFSSTNPQDMWSEVKSLQAQMQGNCSITFKRAVAKRIADLVVGTRVPSEELEKIYKEIDNAPVVDILVDQIVKDVQAGFLDPDTAAKLRGYPEGTADKAQKAHAQRLKLIQTAQTPGQGMGAAAARGVADQSPAPGTEVQAEKDALGNPVRGEGKNNLPPEGE